MDSPLQRPGGIAWPFLDLEDEWRRDMLLLAAEYRLACGAA
jgi:hypothetical protein